MNFELIDNFMQVGVMLVAAVADIIFWFRQKDRIYIILALEHGCFMMGTLYYVLYLFIRGDVPQIFYVAEISWISSYLFLHTYQIVRREGEKSRFAPVPAVCAAVIFIVAMRSEIFGPAILSTGAFAVTVGAITYIAVFHMQYGDDIRLTDVWPLICVILQLVLYISSHFFNDYTKFNLYFLIDFVLTLSVAGLLPCTVSEVKKHDVY